MAIKNFNELYWKLFKIAGGGSDNDVTKVLDSIVKSDRSKLDQYFTNAIDQIAFDVDDYNRLRNYFIDLFTAHRALITNSAKFSDPHFLSNDDMDELFRSFGYPESTRLKNFDNNPLETKVQLFLDLVNLYKIKGTPRSILEVLQYYGIPQLDIFEFWLQKDDPSTLIFKGDVIVGTSINPSPIKLPYDIVTMNDPHWMMTENQILNLDSINKINLPSKTPYFAVQPVVEIGIENNIFVRLIQDQYDQWESTGVLPPQNAEITMLGVTISLLELYLLTLYSFQKDFDIGSEITDFACYDGTNTDFTAIVDEYENIISRPITRESRRLKYAQYLDMFTRSREEHFLYNQGDNAAGKVLNIINPTLIPELEALTSNNIDVLQSLLKDLAVWVRNNVGFGFVNLGYIFFGLNQLFEDLKPVINFFKPYRARLIVLELLQFNNILTESIPMEDGFLTDFDFTICDFITGNSIPCCPEDTTAVMCIDSTSTGSFYSRDTYDCGSYYDIGAVTDISKPFDMLIDQYICDSFRCPTGCPSTDSTSVSCCGISNADICDRLTGLVPDNWDGTNTPIIVPDTSYCSMLKALTVDTVPYVFQDEMLRTMNNIVDLEIGDVDKVIDFPITTDLTYRVNVNLFNILDGTSTSIYATVTHKSEDGFTVEFSSPIDSNGYKLSWIINPESTFSSVDSLTLNQNTHRVNFDYALPLDTYSINTAITNITATSIYTHIITNKDVNGFDVEFSDAIDSTDYSLDWNVYDSTSTIPHGINSIPIGAEILEVNIPTQVDTLYNIDLSIINVIDSPVSIYSYIIIEKNIDSFKISFSGPIVSSNYNISWAITYPKEVVEVTCKDIPNVFSEVVIDTFERIENLAIGTESINILFTEDLGTDLYVLNINLFNETDGNSASMYGMIVTDKSSSGFTILFSSPLDSINYKIAWNVNTNATFIGVTNLTYNSNTHRINFDYPLLNINYSIATAMTNQVDVNPSIYNFIVKNKDLNGFDIELSGVTDSTNYVLDWNVYDSTSFIPNGEVSIPEDAQWLEVDIDPDQDNDQYSLALSILNTVDSSASIYSYIVTQKNNNNFTVRFSSPIDSGNYKLCWAITYRSTQEYIYKQESGFRLFDTMGRFDCTHGFDMFEVRMEVVSQDGVILQENEGWLLQEDAILPSINDYGLLLD